MNLRIAPEQIRFRISADEFESLMATGVLENTVQLSDALHCVYVIRTNTAEKSKEGRVLELSTTALSNGTRLELTLYANGVSHLQSGQCGKDGLREHLAFVGGELLSIGLEIDLHSKNAAN